MENIDSLSEEQKQVVLEAFGKLAETFERTWKLIKEKLTQIWEIFKKIIEKDAKVRKYIQIYNRTHNKRIKKKQITKIRKILNE